MGTGSLPTVPGGALMFRPIDPQRPADLPERTLPFWRMAGPGAVLVGLSIGAGEIIVWPGLVARYGASMIWVAVVGLVLQFGINLEVGRYTIATGESIFTGYSRVWRGFAPVFMLLTVASTVAPGWARASGLTFKALLVGPAGFGSDTFWTGLTFAAIWVLLFGPKVAYRAVEKSIEVLVALITLGMIAVAVQIGSGETWLELLGGAVNVGYRHPDMPVKTMFIALVFAGAGGTTNLFYSYYLRDKQIGMGAQVPAMRNPLRGKVEAVPSAGFRFGDSAGNAARFKGWWRYVVQDQVLFFLGLNALTLMLFVYGALAALRPRGIVPAPGTLIWDEAQILAELIGEPGRILFLVVGAATLLSCQIAIVDGVARCLADMFHTNFRFGPRLSLGSWYLALATAMMVVGTLITGVMESRGVSELGFFFNSAYMGGFAMALYVPLNLWVNHRYLPRAARPGIFASAFTLLSSMVYIGFAAYCLADALR